MSLRILRLFVAVLLLCAMPATGLAQSKERDRIEKIKDKPKIFKWGEGFADTKEEANSAAISNLISKIKLSATGQLINDWSNDATGEGYDRTQGTLNVTSAASLQNLDEISFQDGDSWTVFRYIKLEDLQQAIDDRHECERDLVYQAIEQEKKLNIAGALRYYNWALTMVCFYGDQNLKIKVGGEEKVAEMWLRAQIATVLNNLKLELREGAIEEDPDSYDRYTVIVNASYAGTPVSALDIKYFNGESNYTAHAKSGQMALQFPDIEGMSDVDLEVQYAYAKEAREMAGNAELKGAYAGSEGAFNSNDLAKHNIKLKYNKGKVKLEKQTSPTVALHTDGKATADAAMAKAGGVVTANVNAPITQKARKTIDRDYINNNAAYIDAMKAVEQAIRSKKYADVKNLFTDEGYALFKLMTEKGKLSVASAPTYSVEGSNLFTIGKGIPVTVKNGKHVSKETIVFRFEQNSAKIKSVAYAMTERAESDIFRKADWSLESRYSLLTFMEDYQTAFALQRLDYIEKIFSDNAIIITGKYVDSKATAGMMEGLTFNSVPHKNIVYAHQTKDEYIGNLKRLFKNNSWTHIEFEENEISKSSTSGFLDHEIMWIEIRQNWTSASGYNDTGFLGLQINLKPSGSMINIRTWTPDFIDIDELRDHFSTEIKF